MATQDEYEAAYEELMGAAQSEIATDVPVFLRGQVPTDKVSAFCHRASKAVVDRLDAMRADQGQAPGSGGTAGNPVDGGD